MTRKRRRSNRKGPSQESVGIIDPYKVVDEDALAEELDAFVDGERPVFAVPGLDEVLEGTDREAEQIMKIYLL